MSRSSAEAELAHTACEMMWLKFLLLELEFIVDGPMFIYCNNQAAIHSQQSCFFMTGPST